ncbi:hypothetical protein D049_2362 [Vibrio parahaemolyticus VPTS-2010]|nr:hypothetical protein D049_2362 [Vibrio parahaemolyticus VPTS-2010]
MKTAFTRSLTKSQCEAHVASHLEALSFSLFHLTLPIKKGLS